MSETIREQSNRTEQIKQDISSNNENMKEELKKDMDKMNEITERNHEITEKKHLELFTKLGEGESNLEKFKQYLDSNVMDSKNELQNAINNLGWSGLEMLGKTFVIALYVADLKQCEEFKNAKDALSNTIDKEAQDVEEIQQRLRNQKLEFEDQINMTMTKFNKFEEQMSQKWSNLENNELDNLKKTFFESFDNLKEKIGKCQSCLNTVLCKKYLIFRFDFK